MITRNRSSRRSSRRSLDVGPLASLPVQVTTRGLRGRHVPAVTYPPPRTPYPAHPPRTPYPAERPERPERAEGGDDQRGVPG